ncbi:MAG TPA: LysE family translocator [Acidimicrobiales bacterium]|nr:LysE family translocator [Acidimicrobiales bacterium]
MPSASSVISFALVAALVTASPGLDTALVLRSALNRGRLDAAATSAGISLGVLVWAVAAATGVSALLTASEAAYNGLRIAGAAYMSLLGARLLRNALRRHETGSGVPSSRREPSLWAAFRSGFVTNLLNPKVGAFYVALLPQFIPADGSPVLAGILLGVVHNVEGILWFSLIILGADAARRHLARRSTERWIEGLTGTALVGFGIRLARSNPH